MLGFLFKKNKKEDKEEIEAIKNRVEHNKMDISNAPKKGDIDSLHHDLVHENIAKTLKEREASSNIKEEHPIPNTLQQIPQASKGSISSQEIPHNIKDIPPSPVEKPYPTDHHENLVSNKPQENKKDDISSLFSPESVMSLTSSENMDKKDNKESQHNNTDNVEDLFAKKEKVENKEEDQVISGESNILIKNMVTHPSKISPPLFISVNKYREIVNELMSLKVSITTLESILGMSKKIESEEKEKLNDFLDELNKINNYMKYFANTFKLKSE